MTPEIQRLGRTIRTMGFVMRLVREAHNCSSV
jgi:hypothetical protein